MTKEELKKTFGPKAIGQVVRIMNDHSIIIDVGDRITPGNKIQVYEYAGNLTGLDGNDLGSLEFVKAELTVIRREPKYSICETELIREESVFAVSPILVGKKIYQRFEVDKGELEPFTFKDHVVRVGDPVKLA